MILAMRTWIDHSPRPCRGLFIAPPWVLLSRGHFRTASCAVSQGCSTPWPLRLPGSCPPVPQQQPRNGGRGDGTGDLLDCAPRPCAHAAQTAVGGGGAVWTGMWHVPFAHTAIAHNTQICALCENGNGHQGRWRFEQQRSKATSTHIPQLRIRTLLSSRLRRS